MAIGWELYERTRVGAGAGAGRAGAGHAGDLLALRPGTSPRFDRKRIAIATWLMLALCSLAAWRCCRLRSGSLALIYGGLLLTARQGVERPVDAGR